MMTILAAVMAAAVPSAPRGPVLGIADTQFTLNGRPTFLLGISYYGGLGAPDRAVRRDLDAMKRHGFNWIRVWATWAFGDSDVSAVDAAGKAREPYMGRLVRLVDECARRGMVVDVTLSRGRSAVGGGISGLEAHRQAVRSVMEALKGRRNWYLDLANERDVGDARYVPTREVRELRILARELDPGVPVTASFGGHDLSESYLREALIEAGLDFVAPHRPRHAESPAQTEGHTRNCIEAMRGIGRLAPVHYQEPFRRGYGDWEPTYKDFLDDLRGAVRGGAAGWCLHNGSVRGRASDRPRRSFDMREQGLFEQLDEHEMTVVRRAAEVVRQAARVK